jgi:hypothetical protein
MTRQPQRNSSRERLPIGIAGDHQTTPNPLSGDPGESLGHGPGRLAHSGDPEANPTQHRATRNSDLALGVGLHRAEHCMAAVNRSETFGENSL